MPWTRVSTLFLAAVPAFAAVAVAEPVTVPGLPCDAPELHCRDAGCGVEVITHAGNAVEPKTGRSYFLDYPCGLEAGAEVHFILNIHGTGAPANWQRHYFPAHDFKDRYRLIVATPQAQGDSKLTRMPQQWGDDVDLDYIRGVVEHVYETFADLEIDRMWLVGHSQGGSYAHRLVCSDGFRDRVDGLAALAGGYPGVRDSALPECEFSFILETGSEDTIGNRFPDRAPWADRLECGAKEDRGTIEDPVAGYVYDTRTEGRPSIPGWGGEPAPGEATFHQYRDCRDGRVVAEFVRQEKGHTEGHEANVTERILQLMLTSAK